MNVHPGFFSGKEKKPVTIFAQNGGAQRLSNPKKLTGIPEPLFTCLA